MRVVICLFTLAFIAIASEARKHLKFSPKRSNLALSNTESRFVETYQKFKNTCRCVQKSCTCCFLVQTLGYKGCASYSLDVEQLTLKVTVDLEGERLIDADYPIAEKVSVCGKFSPKLQSLNYCLIQDFQEAQNDMIRACTSLALQTNHKAQSAVKFGCLLLRPTDLTFDGKTQIRSSSFVNSWANKKFVKDRQAFKAII